MSKKTYTPTPSVPAEIAQRYQTMLEVISGALSVSDGARRLGMSRNHFQTLMHRGLEGMIGALTPKAPGRPSKSEREQQLQAEADRLRRENQTLQNRVNDTDRLLEVASGFLKGRIQPTGRSRRTKAEKSPEASGEQKDDPDGERRRRLEGAIEMRSLGLIAPLAAAVVGLSVATVSRWKARDRRGLPLAEKPGPAAGVRPLRSKDDREARKLVRETHGLIGAEALRQSVPLLSRRQAATIKCNELRVIERERREQAQRVVITQPDVIRGMDAMHVGEEYLLIAADAAIPYRTWVTRESAYDEGAVYRFIEGDIAANGPPLVYRLDRWKAHRTPKVQSLMKSHGTLLLHGPPHLPRYYGQLERQNRDHREWIDAGDGRSDEQDLLHAMNCCRPRATLGWLTPEQCWKARPKLDVDRSALREEVEDQAARLRPKLKSRGAPADMAERLAIEQVLKRRGYLRLEVGGWC